MAATRRSFRHLASLTLPSVLLLAAIVLALEVGELAFARIAGHALPAYQYPLPHKILGGFLANRSVILAASAVTIGTSVIGFIGGALIGAGVSSLLWLFPTLERALSPYLTLIPILPIIAVAPLVSIVVPDPFLARILLASYLTCFPVIVNTIKGLLNVDDLLMELVQTYGVSRWSQLRKLHWPHALPFFFAGVRVGVTFSIIGTIVLEFTGAGSDGLGALMLQISYYGAIGDTAYFLWAAALSAAGIGLVLYGLVALVERLVTHPPPRRLVPE
jgi:NitT/TauT family transport system permease protein